MFKEYYLSINDAISYILVTDERQQDYQVIELLYSNCCMMNHSDRSISTFISVCFNKER